MQKMTAAQAREVKGGWAFVAVAAAFGVGWGIGKVARAMF